MTDGAPFGDCVVVAYDVATAKTILHDYVNATVGFTDLAEATHIPSKSLMRMLGPAGNPRTDNLFEIVNFLQCAAMACASKSRPRARSKWM